MMTKITIRDNLSYCRENHRMSVVWEPCFDCEMECGFFSDELFFKPNPDCKMCGGSGTEVIETEPFVFKVAGPNFSTIWSALGLTPSEEGETYTHNLSRTLKTLDPALLLRSSRVGPGVKLNHGITQDRADWYLENLEQIVQEAESREEKLVWGPCFK